MATLPFSLILLDTYKYSHVISVGLSKLQHQHLKKVTLDSLMYVLPEKETQ